ncbi:MAG: bile acid:sodium symporter family protein [Peptostreptococcaceae bacterium]
MNYLEKLSNFAAKYMAYIILVVVGVSLLRPSTFLFAAPHVNTLLGVIMFSMGMTLKLEDFKLVLTRPKDVLLGCLSQFTIMPLVAFLVAKVFNLPTELAVGLILVGCCPGGTSSNVMAFIAKGDVALSVTLTSVATLMAPFLTPALTLFLGGTMIEVSMQAMFVSIIKVVLVPILAGVLCNRFLSKLVEQGTKIVPLISVTALAFIVGSIVAKNSSQVLTSGWVILVAVAIHNSVGYFMGYLIARKLGLEEAKRRTMAIEVGLQNAGLASSLSMTHFSPMTAIPGVVASVYHSVSGALLANFWSKVELDKADDRVELKEA